MNSLSKTVESSHEKSPFPMMIFLKFIIPSIIGILLFMVPVKANGEITIPVALIANQITTHLETIIPTITVILISLSVLGSIMAVLFKPSFIMESSFLKNLFFVNKFWFIVRVMGMVISILTLTEIGPAWVSSEDTGGLLLYNLVPILFSVFLLAGFLLPLLLNFGLLEFFGALLMKVMRPVFTLPGRSSLDCIASWVGDGTIGVILTTKQYEEGFYTKREAAVIATTFSVVSITFSIAILSYLNLSQYFVPYYLTILFIGLVAALIMPRIPPLSRKPDTGYENVELKAETPIPAGITPAKWGLQKALTKARNSSGVAGTVKEGFQNVLDMWLGVLPAVITIGTVALIIADYTPFFAILGKPFEPILALLQIPEAASAAQTMVVGFADMFLPAVIGSGIESELTRFVIACISVTQLIYMSELGGLLLGSKLPLNIKDLILIFLIRTLITLPIAAVVGHILF